ncbi:hypothetical protein Tsubulata_019747 [Turnera subulata]|uniref:Protein TIC110, chloroplastic n=1 Tax=Turnera subulata TaxID=218843 RepID=A0A9Q0FW70_9ROSI|nr:hypothetical protein Tsubulata_019747 [Turnera subulata]
MNNPSLLTTLSPPPLPLTLTPPSLSLLPKRRRFRVSVPRNSADPETHPSDAEGGASDVFGRRRELEGIKPLVGSLPPSLRLASSAVILAGAVAAGYGLGLQLGHRLRGKWNPAPLGGAPAVGVAGAAAMGVAGGAMVYAMNGCAPEVAAASLHNYVAGCDDPLMVRKEEIQNILTRYGVSKEDYAFNAELCDLYRRFVASVLPPGSEDLKGNEVEMITEFKNALGIEDEDAAAMHIEVGKRISRQRIETGDYDDNKAEQRRVVQAFQKLIFVSNLVFGDASTFLLPWKRVFKITDSVVEISVRDNAQRLYASNLNSIGEDIGAEQLVKLRQAQLSYQLSDELAQDLFRQHTRKLLGKKISAAIEILKSRTRAAGGIMQVVKELDEILAFNNRLVSLKNHADAASFALGVGPVSLVGGEYDSERKIDDLKLLYRAYITDVLSGGRMEEHKLDALSQLRNIFGLGKREAEEIYVDVTSKVYKKQLAQAAAPGGALDMADSKAAFLQNLCEELRLDPQKATEVHEEVTPCFLLFLEIYRQKLQQCLADGELCEKDVSSLTRLRVLLCIPQETVEAAHSDICGNLFKKVVKDAIVHDYDLDSKKAVRKAAHGLRLTRKAAMSVASEAVRRVFIKHIKQARTTSNRAEIVQELTKMIAFNTSVVTDLVADIKGESPEEHLKEEKEQIQEEEEWDDKEWGSLKTLQKVKPTLKLADEKGKPWQTEINLKEDLPERDRTELYKTYLIHCLTGDSVRLPFELKAVSVEDGKFVQLNRLGWILGLSAKEIVGIHKDLAVQTFRQQAEAILADGQMTKARTEQLNEIQEDIGVPQEFAQKIIKSITTSKIAAAVENAITRGRLDIKQIRELKEANVDVHKMISDSSRSSILKKTIDEIFSSGKGDFDEEEVYIKIPADLNINTEKAKALVHELARSRLTNSLIQAVALLRQRNHKGVVSTLNDLLACDKAVPSEPLRWEVPEELVELYGIYLKSDPEPEKLSRMQYLLGINDSTANSLQETKNAVTTIGAEEEEFAF